MRCCEGGMARRNQPPGSKENRGAAGSAVKKRNRGVRLVRRGVCRGEQDRGGGLGWLQLHAAGGEGKGVSALVSQGRRRKGGRDRGLVASQEGKGQGKGLSGLRRREREEEGLGWPVAAAASGAQRRRGKENGVSAKLL